MHDDEFAPKKDTQTVDADWQSISPRIHGVEIKFLPTIPDDRGTLCEVFRPAWGVHPVRWSMSIKSPSARAKSKAG